MNPQEVKNKSRGYDSRDMSSEAIAKRLDMVSELLALSLWLGTAKEVKQTHNFSNSGYFGETLKK